jgi:hypothetical protein
MKVVVQINSTVRLPRGKTFRMPFAEWIRFDLLKVRTYCRKTNISSLRVEFTGSLYYVET